MSNDYIGEWNALEDLNREVQVGDLVMIETLDDTLVVGVAKIEADVFRHLNNWIIPKHSVIAIKKSHIC